MNKKIITSLATFLFLSIFLLLNSCSDTAQKPKKEEASSQTKKAVYPSDVIKYFSQWNLILGDGSNAGNAKNFEHKDFFYTANDGKSDWIVYKTPNAGDTHGTSNCLLYTSPSPRDATLSRMPSSA